ncbi:MAG: TIGR00730 family Rossman fold protein [Planctomycetia bacterium]|nr:TIGR00730 family Rossman fold protein [Planctomycetia bacterium]
MNFKEQDKRDEMTLDSNPNPMVQNILKSSSYSKAYADNEFLNSDSARELRLLSEYLKTDATLRQKKVLSTIIVFGSARILPPEVAKQRLLKIESEEKGNPGFNLLLRRAQENVKMSVYYEQAREFAQIVSRANPFDDLADYQRDASSEKPSHHYKFVICTGGGPGIMEAANRGAFEAGGISIGLNISLPFEQQPNPYITPNLCFQYHYFAIRKLHFMLRARALVIFPGGFGTLDELFEGLTLRQTGKMQDLPIVLFGKAFWQKCIDFDYLVETGVISPHDLDLIHYAETPQEGWDIIKSFYREAGSVNR